jgi:hypothetical protein
MAHDLGHALAMLKVRCSACVQQLTSHQRDLTVDGCFGPLDP